MRVWQSKKNKQRGILLVEALVALLIFGLFLFFLTKNVMVTQKSMKITDDSLAMNRAASNVVEVLAAQKITVGQDGVVGVSPTGVKIDPQEPQKPDEKRFGYTANIYVCPNSQVYVVVSVKDVKGNSVSAGAQFTVDPASIPAS